ncbi:MAG TPA: TadE/TadG family type IV pilus assembly protein [Sphingomicrobium sp.]|jgi:Flp pilus assembly protein TadG|nr:TadE/TadG family type IV pilus assembly protein [Sphingomicrobium sp.]
MRLRLRLARDTRGAAAVEMAFAVPIMIVMIWAFVQLAQVFRASAGIQQALGQGARYATLCLTQSANGCTAPTADQIRTRINASVYGIGPGTFTVGNPTSGTAGTARYYDLTVTYTQPTNLLIFPGPTMTITRSKRVWIATSA